MRIISWIAKYFDVYILSWKGSGREEIYKINLLLNYQRIILTIIYTYKMIFHTKSNFIIKDYKIEIKLKVLI